MYNPVVRRALHANAIGTRVRHCVRARVYYMHVRVHGVHCGCVWCGRRDADCPEHMRLRLVLYRMSLLWRAVQVHRPYSYTWGGV